MFVIESGLDALHKEEEMIKANLLSTEDKRKQTEAEISLEKDEGRIMWKLQAYTFTLHI